MRSLYYLSHGTGLKRFEDVFEEENILATTFDTENIHSLTAFVKQERAIGQQTYLVIDVGTMRRWSVGHVLSAVQYLRRFSKTRLIFIGEPDSDDVAELFKALSDKFHIDDLITAEQTADAGKDLRDCFALDNAVQPGDRLRIAKDVLLHGAPMPEPQLAVQEGLVVRVAVCGAMPRCGTTTQAVGIYHYLTRLGLRPVIIDATGVTLERLERFESVRRGEVGETIIRDVRFANGELTGYNACILDCGILTEERAAMLADVDFAVLVSGVKPWELPELAHAAELLGHCRCGHAATITSFATPEDVSKLKALLGEHVAAASYAPDIWGCPTDCGAYAELLLPWLRELCLQPQLVSEPEVSL